MATSFGSSRLGGSEVDRGAGVLGWTVMGWMRGTPRYTRVGFVGVAGRGWVYRWRVAGVLVECTSGPLSVSTPLLLCFSQQNGLQRISQCRAISRSARHWALRVSYWVQSIAPTIPRAPDTRRADGAPSDRHDWYGIIDGVENPIGLYLHPQAALCALHALHATRSRIPS